MSLFLVLSIFFNFMLMFSTHPLSMGLVILMQTLMIALATGYLLPSFWFSYILVLIFLGGMLILFIYVASMAPNEILTSNLKFPLILSTATFLLLSTNLPQNLTELMKSSSFMNISNYTWLYSSPLAYLAIFLIVYLFLVLLAIVKIIKWWGGAIRPLF